MPIGNLIFENPPGTRLETRQFEPGQALRIGSHITGPLGLGEPFVGVNLDIYGPGMPSIYDTTNTNILGDCWFDIELPSVHTQATVRITVPDIFGDNVREVPIGIGVTPEPIPQPGDAIVNVIKWAAIGVGAGILGFVLVNQLGRRK